MGNGPKVAIIGAGGYIFPLQLARDILSYPELQGTEFSLMDIHKGRLERNAGRIRSIISRNGLAATVKASTNRRKALCGADFIIVAFQVGGIDAYRYDVEIPKKYGVDQPVADTLGPGGVFRGLRTMAVFRELAGDIREVCPGALVIQYANPMSINCWALNEMGVKCVGLCHSVQYTSQFLATAVGVPYDECTFLSAGVNHQAWFTEFRHKGRDILPLIRETLSRTIKSPKTANNNRYVQKGSDHKVDDEVYYYERVRTEIMRMTGYFHTESSHHGSEYVPWFRKNPAVVKAYIPHRWDYYQISRTYQSKGMQKHADELVAGPLKPGTEYGAPIIHSMVTGKPSVIHGNVPNYGRPGSAKSLPGSQVIANLPSNCCVEVPCLVDGNGVQPVAVGSLPTVCAAVNARMVAVQELAVEGGLAGDPEKIQQAVAMDPLTGALLTLPRIRSMVDEMLRAEARWLPQFKSRKG
jgi:alpha-galactosidase